MQFGNYVGAELDSDSDSDAGPSGAAAEASGRGGQAYDDDRGLDEVEELEGMEVDG